MPSHVDDPCMQESGTRVLVWLNKQPSEAVVAKALNLHQQPLGWQNMAMLQVCSGGPKYVTAMETPEKLKTAGITKGQHKSFPFQLSTKLKKNILAYRWYLQTKLLE